MITAGRGRAWTEAVRLLAASAQPADCRGHVLDVFSGTPAPHRVFFDPKGPETRSSTGVTQVFATPRTRVCVCLRCVCFPHPRPRPHPHQASTEKARKDKHLGARRHKTRELSTDPTRHANAGLAATSQGKTTLQ